MAIKSYLDLESLNLSGRKVFLRLDLNVPLKNGEVLDTNRIQAALPTLKYIIDQGAKVIVASHLGRPKTDSDQQKLSLEPVAKCLNDEGFEVLLMDSPQSDAPLELIKSLSGNQIILLENLRFHHGETSNSGELAAKWAKYTDVYVNDAFGASHRAHASIDALAQLIPERAYGFLIKKEVEALKKIKESPERPFALLTGGSKVSDKIPLLDGLSENLDEVMIGGAMAYTFLKAKGFDIGNSRFEKESLVTAERFLKRMNVAGKPVHLPVDHIVLEDFQSDEFKIQDSSSIDKGFVAVDIGPKTIKLFSEVIKNAGTVFWNGPMGIYERKPFDKGSTSMAKALAESNAFTVIGGGDSAAAAIDSGHAGDIDHISTGGGASLEFIQGIALPGLEALQVRVAE